MAKIDIDNDLGWNVVSHLEFHDDFKAACSSIHFLLSVGKYYDFTEPGSSVFIFNLDWDVTVHTVMSTNPNQYQYNLELFPTNFNKNIDSVEPSFGKLCKTADVKVAEGAIDCEFPIPHKNVTFGGLLANYRRQFWEVNIDHPENTQWLYYGQFGVTAKSYSELDAMGPEDFYANSRDANSYRDFKLYYDQPYSEFYGRTFPSLLDDSQFYNYLFNLKIECRSTVPFIIGKKYKLRHAFNAKIEGQVLNCIDMTYKQDETDTHKFSGVFGKLNFDSIPRSQSGSHPGQSNGTLISEGS